MNETQLQPIDLPDADLHYAPAWLSPAEAEAAFARLAAEVPWRRDHITLFGRQVAIPRLQAWYGDPGTDYRYSSLALSPLPWTPTLSALREKVEAACQCRFNSVLINYYRDGNDSVGWHRDNEPELGPRPRIASLTLGQPRRFTLRHRTRKELKHQLELASGSLLLMAGDTQHCWLHALPKSRRDLGPRINLSFRYLRHAAERDS